MRIGIVCYPTYGGSGAVATELGLASVIPYSSETGEGRDQLWRELLGLLVPPTSS